MKLTSRRLTRGNRIELAMTSMIDVIFLLLIFFLLNVGYHVAERELDSGIQTQSNSRTKSHLDPVVVDIARSGGGDYVFKFGGREVADAAELTRLLRLMPQGGGAFVRVRDDSPFALVAAAIQSCYDAGFLSVSYVPQSPGG